jgi:hypothetical protein
MTLLPREMKKQEAMVSGVVAVLRNISIAPMLCCRVTVVVLASNGYGVKNNGYGIRESR